MFTSRLPISTSVRRPRPDGSTSFAGLNRPSNIPVTVRKANLFTPQTKRPFSTGASTAGKSYLSTGKATERKHQRPLKPAPDRDTQMRMFETMVDFLNGHSYPYPPPDAKKFFSSISTTESSRLFEFIIGQVIPDFKVNRLEIDVPEALAVLDYPYIRSVTKSSLVSVTTRQAVVGLLVIFDWLVDAIRQCEMAENSDDEDGPLDRHRELCKIARYAQPEQFEELCQQLVDRLHPLPNRAEILGERMRIESELDELEADRIRRREIEQEIQIVEGNISNCKQYLIKMDKYEETKQAEIARLELRQEEFNQKFEEQTIKLKQLRAEIENNPMTVEEAKRYISEAQKLRDEISEAQRKTASYESEAAKIDERIRSLHETEAELDAEIVADLRSIYDSYEAIERICSKGERSKEIREWMIKLEQGNIDHREAMNYNLFLEELKATVGAVEADIDEFLSKEEMEVKDLREKVRHYENVVAPTLRASKERVQREMENEEKHAHNRFLKLQLQIDDLRKHTADLEKEFAQELQDLEKELELKRVALETDERELPQLTQLRKDHLTLVIERNRNRLLALKNECLRRLQQREEEFKISEANRKALKRALARAGRLQ